LIIIGEKINSSLKFIRPAMESYDTAFIQDIAKKQAEAGASFIDVNAGMFAKDEPERLAWLVKTVQEVVDIPLAIDSPDPKALEQGLLVSTTAKPLINSISDEKDKYDSVLPLIKQFNARVCALCMDDSGMPETIEDRVRIADRLINKLTKEGIAIDDIFIDPMVRPIGTGSHYGKLAVETIRQIKTSYPEVHIACGLSNISFGIPARKLMNQTFLVAAMCAGMDGAILDPLDTKLMSFIYSTEALLGLDDYCMEYVTKFKEGILTV